MKKFSIVLSLIILFSFNSFAVNFDYDDKADLLVYRPSNSVWYCFTSESKSYSGAAWGTNSDVLTPADFDGDGLTDLAVWRPENGIWYVLRSRDQTLFAVQWGMRVAVAHGFIDDVPVAADYDDDGLADFAVWRPTTGVWYVLESAQGYNPAKSKIFQWGKLADVPVAADYDGDGRTDFAVFRPTENRWYIFESKSGNWYSAQFGLAGYDLLIPFDYTGDGKADIAVYRDGNWLIRKSEDGSLLFYYFGLANDNPVPADYTGDGKIDIAVFRNGVWYIQDLVNGQITTRNFGMAGDLPLIENGAKESVVSLP